MSFARTLKRRLSESAHQALGAVGMQAAWISPKSSDDVCLQHFLAAHGVDLIFDVGANKGQYAEKVFAHGYGGRIVSFEPLSAPLAVLEAKSRKRPGWEVAERCCIGDRTGEIEVNISESSIASSILPLSAEHLRVSPDAAYVGIEKAPMYPLDELFDRHLGEATRPFLKIDVQGFESEVLDGARRSIPHLVGMQVELSLVDAYESQKGSFSQMIRRIEEMGFELIRFFPSFIDTATGRWLQADGLFFRSG